MRKLTAAAILFSGAVMASQATYAGAIANDLYLGFENQAGGGSADYIINLGSAASILNAGGVVNLSSYFISADFTSAQLTGNNAADIMGGVVGAANGITADVYVTQLRSGGAGISTVAGSAAPSGLSTSVDDQAYAAFSNLNGPAAGTGILDATLSWDNHVEPTYTTQSFYGETGINPDSSVSNGSVLYEDLWFATGSAGFSYEGYFTLDLSGSNPSLTFTPAATPEPATTSLLGGGVLLFGAFRWWNNRNARKTA